MKNIYEVFDEFEEAKNKKERMEVIGNNLSKTLVQVLELAFHRNQQWLITDYFFNYWKQLNPVKQKLLWVF